MIKIENLAVWGWEHTIRGMRNPMNSWDKSDSYYEQLVPYHNAHKFVIGENDLKLMQNLFKASLDNNFAHRKFMRQIMISMDITAPLYLWREFDTYKVGTVSNSCSTMHKIHSEEFTLDDFSYEHLKPGMLKHLQDTIGMLNSARAIYNNTKDKEDWWQMIQLLPSSYNQKRTITMNYEVAITMIKQRRGHKLDEWNEFVAYLWKKLPYLQDIVGEAFS